MDKNQLLELREKIVQRTQQLALTSEAPAVDRLQVLLGIVRSGGANSEILSKAYELTESIETDEAKLSALLDLLYEIDEQLSNEGEVSENPSVPTETEQPQQNQGDAY